MLIFIFISAGLIISAMIFAAMQLSPAKREKRSGKSPYLMGNASLIERTEGDKPKAASGKDSSRQWKNAA